MKFDKVFKIATTALRLNRSYPAIAHDKLWIIQFIFLCVICVFCTVILFYSILIHDIPNKDYTRASRSGIVVLISATISFKYIILVVYKKSINNLISIIDRDYDLAVNFPDDEKHIVMYYQKKGIKVCKIWLVTAITSSSIFPLKACLLMAYLVYSGNFKFIHVFEVTYPAIIENVKNTVPGYWALFVLSITYECYATTMYSGFDPLVPIFLLHCCGQIDIISHRIRKLLSETADEQEIHEKLKNIILKLQEIYWMVDHMKDNFTILYEFTMKTTTFLLPLSAFQVLQCLRNRDANFEFIPFCLGSLIHLYMPCYYSDLLMEKGEDLRLSIYSCGWEKGISKRTSNTIMFMLARATRPLVLATIFFPVCLATFAGMCSNAYAIFNLMNAAWT